VESGELRVSGGSSFAEASADESGRRLLVGIYFFTLYNR